MDSEIVKKVVDLNEKTMTIEVDGKTFARADFHQIKYSKPRPAHIEGSTLTSLVEYIQANREQINLGGLMVHVHDHANVSLIERFTDEDAKRTTFFRSVLDKSLPVFNFDQYMPVEEFIIKSRALMMPCDDLDAIIAIVSRVVAQDELQTQDNGLAQTVQVKKGISGAMSQGVETKGMYELRPYRTFRELQQPSSRFILRLKAVEGALPHVALFDAEGGAWRYAAMLAVKDWIDEKLVGIDIPVLA